MTEIPFIVSARAGKLLGRENFSNPEGAIIELVKNSYDADAKSCLVVFDIVFKIEKDEQGNDKKTLNNDSSSIFIIDNGEGMSKDVIENQWMKIGTGNKETEFISKNKRVKTGAKGIGRFALDRLGFNAEMWTVSNESNGFNWKMDWKQFDNSDKSISEITAELSDNNVNISEFIKTNFNHIKLEKIFNVASFNTGTILKISNLKDEWYENDIAGVFKSLEALIPPKELNMSFEVNFQHIQKPKEFGKVETAFFNDYDYKLIAKFNAEKLSVDFEITRNEMDIDLIKKNYSDLYKNAKTPYDLKTLENKTFKYSKGIDELLEWEFDENNTKLLKNLGSFNLTFYYLKYNVSLKEGYPFKSINQKERRSVLHKFGGVKIYRDSFRVRPYGDPDNDWLKLGARVAQSPAGSGQRIGDWRVRPEQTAGIITISRKNNPNLIDKSDRGALQENDSYETFKSIIIKVINEFEVDRTKILNVLFKHFKILKEKERENEIQRRAESLADIIVAERKVVEEKLYGKKYNDVDLFQQKREEEERRKYEEAFKDTFKAIDDEKIEKDNEEIVQVRGLASLGLIVSSFAHELKEVKNNVEDINDLENIYKDLVSDEAKKKIEFNDGVNIIKSLKLDTEKIIHWVDYSLTAVKKDKRKRGNLDFIKYFDSLSKEWKNVLKNRNIELVIKKDTKAKYLFRAFEMDMNTIFSNLISNSIDSFQNLKVMRDRKILIIMNLENENLIIDYSDNGTGLSKAFDNNKENIFLPFTTSKKDRNGNDIGTGLGMYLVKNVIDDYNGDIMISNTDIGFKIRIEFPIRKNEKNEI
ncbi:sensor histidine kinase [Flavobacterium sp. 5]|uniref:sensor histidine kinase n=1 Tax=Flavobacterium sp. 5 TaxID=2035199 RepID=UPI000C2C8049|nr:sensor histidine kinase [Flavobacterium sp. 5]PKB15112.1 histidine kinase/DNA gyrase B/HSP90-like ATPase [Flavobacterium sp. 5]